MAGGEEPISPLAGSQGPPRLRWQAKGGARVAGGKEPTLTEVRRVASRGEPTLALGGGRLDRDAPSSLSLSLPLLLVLSEVLLSLESAPPLVPRRLLVADNL